MDELLSLGISRAKQVASWLSINFSYLRLIDSYKHHVFSEIGTSIMLAQTIVTSIKMHR